MLDITAAHWCFYMQFKQQNPRKFFELTNSLARTVFQLTNRFSAGRGRLPRRQNEVSALRRWAPSEPHGRYFASTNACKGPWKGHGYSHVLSWQRSFGKLTKINAPNSSVRRFVSLSVVVWVVASQREWAKIFNLHNYFDGKPSFHSEFICLMAH